MAAVGAAVVCAILGNPLADRAAARRPRHHVLRTGTRLPAAAGAPWHARREHGAGHRRGGAGRRRRRPARLHRAGARLPRAGGRSARSSPPSRPWSTRPTGSTSGCCSRPTTTRRSPRPGPRVAGPPVSIVLVPSAEPRTKPKACNFGLQGAPPVSSSPSSTPRTGPSRCSCGGRSSPCAGSATDFACVQAPAGLLQRRPEPDHPLVHDRVRHLVPAPAARPGLGRRADPAGRHLQPLPRAVCCATSAPGTPYNVTEDADLGIRLARLGYAVGVLDSITEEEANSDFVNWVKQRSRWYKGYLQTWLVHMRRPVAVHRDLGWRGALGLHLFVLGTPLMALINPCSGP